MNLNLTTISLVKEINLKIERGQKIFLLKNLKDEPILVMSSSAYNSLTKIQIKKIRNYVKKNNICRLRSRKNI